MIAPFFLEGLMTMQRMLFCNIMKDERNDNNNGNTGKSPRPISHECYRALTMLALHVLCVCLCIICVCDRFADVPFPTSEDWEAATGMVYPKTFTHK